LPTISAISPPFRVTIDGLLEQSQQHIFPDLVAIIAISLIFFIAARTKSSKRGSQLEARSEADACSEAGFQLMRHGT
jgi:hypothetical protein